jgi:hypothetical protein
MPFIMALIGADADLDMDRREFSALVRGIVAEELTVKDGQVNPDSGVEMIVFEADPAAGDHTTLAVSLSIDAISYPDRVKDQQSIGDRIKERTVSKANCPTAMWSVSGSTWCRQRGAVRTTDPPAVTRRCLTPPPSRGPPSRFTLAAPQRGPG